MPTVVPIEPDAARGFRVWNISQIYTGPAGPGRYVPNVDDMVLDWDTGFYRVVSVNGLTLLSTLDFVPLSTMNGGVLEEDVLLGSGPGGHSDSYRVYVDNGETPPRLAISSRLYIPGVNASYIKVFRGTDIGPTGTVVSGMWNGSVFTTENIPLVSTPKVAEQAWATESLADNELVTAVVYTAAGVKTGVYKLVVAETNFIHSNDPVKRFVMSVSLVSPYLSVTDTSMLEVPVNAILQSANLQCRVLYSDASVETLPIDGSRVRIMGLDMYSASIAGQPSPTRPLILVYTLQPNEYGYGVNGPSGSRQIQVPYRVRTTGADGAYTVKLFIVPRYQVVPTSTWVLDYYLYDMNRQTVIDVTSFIETSPSTGVFNGGLLNVRQTITASLNLADVSGAYLPYRFIQTFSVQLKASGANTLAGNYWQMEYSNGHVYGTGLIATRADDPSNPLDHMVTVSLNLLDTQDWLDRVYYPTEPLLVPGVEVTPPTPTHFRIRVNGFMREVALHDFYIPIDGIAGVLTQGTPVRLEFFLRDGSTDYELGIGSLTLKV